MKQFLLVALGLLVGRAGQANAQPSYYYTTIDPPHSALTFVGGIKNAGQIVGAYQDVAWSLHGFIYSGGNYTTLDVPGATETVASGINGSGQIVGEYTDAQGRGHGLLLSGSNYTALDVPGPGPTGAHGINSLGQIVGEYSSSPRGIQRSAFMERLAVQIPVRLCTTGAFLLATAARGKRLGLP
jgi:uncharacterized membrane protein